MKIVGRVPHVNADFVAGAKPVEDNLCSAIDYTD